jgi:hypothetical protein
VPGESFLTPILIDEPALRALAEAGYRWLQGRARGTMYRWLLPPDWVLAAEVPGHPPNGVEPLSGGGDRGGKLTAVLTVLKDCADPPGVLVSRGAGPGAQFGAFHSRAGAVAERLETKQGKTLVMTAHAFTAGGQPQRFVIAALGAGTDAETQRCLRMLGTALVLHDELASALDGARLGGRLHG